MREIAVLDVPGLTDEYAPHVRLRLAAAVDRLLPSQRRVYELYRAGRGVAVIAQELGWKKVSVYNRLAELHRLLTFALSDKSSLD